MTTEKCQSLSAVDLLLLAGLVTLEAITVLAVALVALLLTVCGWTSPPAPASAASPSGRCAPSPPSASQTPAVHPLALLAAELEPLPVTRLRELVGVRSKRLRKCELVATLVAR